MDALAQQLGWKAEFLEEDGGLEHIPKANIYQSGWVNELGSSPPCFFLWGALCVSLYHSFIVMLKFYLIRIYSWICILHLSVIIYNIIHHYVTM